MAKFFFRMQNILQIKQKLEEKQQLEYKDALQNRNKQKQKMDQMREVIQSETIRFQKKQENRFFLRELIQVQDRIHFYHRRLKEENDVLKKLEEIVLDKRQILIEAMRERKIYEKLREKASEKYFEEEKLAELKQMDERASFHYSQDNEE